MSKREDGLLMQDILESINRIQEYVRGVQFDQLIDDLKTQDAIIRNLLIIGEAAKLFSDEFKSNYSSLPYREMTGLRDRLAHDYFGINYDIVWDIIQVDLPALRAELASIKFEE
jgi:uncharacterized protein with HEPN domain